MSLRRKGKRGSIENVLSSMGGGPGGGGGASGGGDVVEPDEQVEGFGAALDPGYIEAETEEYDDSFKPAGSKPAPKRSAPAPPGSGGNALGGGTPAAAFARPGHAPPPPPPGDYGDDFGC
jgi:hypothetical protein